MKMILPKRKGFTLIELLIVIVIIGILSVGFAPTLLNAPKKARDGVRKGQIAGVQQALEAYAIDNSSAYPTASAALTCLTAGNADATALAPYFQGSVLPKDPSYTGNTTDTCGISYKNIPASKCYILSVKMEVDGTGNSSVGDNNVACATALADKSGNYYQVIQKY